MALPTFLDLIFKWVGSGRYNASPPVGADGQIAEHQSDDRGYLRVTEDVVATYEQPTALAASDVVSTSPTRFVEAWVENSSGTDRYFQLFDGTVLPADGVAPLYCVRIPAGATVAVKPSARMYFSSGLVWCFSSTRATKTITGSEAWVSLWRV